MNPTPAAALTDAAQAHAWVLALGGGALVAAGGWLVAAGPLRIYRRAAGHWVGFNALVLLGSLAWWPLPLLQALSPSSRLALGLMAWLAGVQALCVGLQRLNDVKPTYVQSPFMLPFLALLLSAAAWLDGAGYAVHMAAAGASLWMLAVTVQQGYPAMAAASGKAAARWALAAFSLAALLWLAGMGSALGALVVGASEADAAAAGGGLPVADPGFAALWLASWAPLNVGLVALLVLKLLDKIRELSTEDELTGAMNMRTFMALLNAERDRIRRHPQVQSVAVVVVDQHEALNRQLGFAAGDAALRHVTGIIGRNLRITDRLGASLQGELLLFLPATPPVGATLVAERNQAAVKAHPFLWRGQAITLTLSVGLASWEDGSLSSEQLIEQAVLAVQRARREGGARIRVAAPAVAAPAAVTAATVSPVV